MKDETFGEMVVYKCSGCGDEKEVYEHPDFHSDVPCRRRGCLTTWMLIVKRVHIEQMELAL